MTLVWAQWLLGAIAVYLALGVIVAAFVVAAGLPRMDPATQGMAWSARLLLLPGVAALWPLMAWKWLSRRQPPVA